MNSEINDKLFDLVDSIESNKKIIRMKELKKLIKKDSKLKKQLDNFHSIIDNPYSDEYVSLKRDILNNELVREYKNLENELYFTVLNINNKLNSLIDKRKCSN